MVGKMDRLSLLFMRHNPFEISKNRIKRIDLIVTYIVIEMMRGAYSYEFKN